MKNVIKGTILIGFFIAAALAHAADPAASNETWSVDGKTFTSKALAVRYIVASGKRLQVQHQRCEILTNKLSFKACPKNKAGSFENEQFESISKAP